MPFTKEELQTLLEDYCCKKSANPQVKKFVKRAGNSAEMLPSSGIVEDCGPRGNGCVGSASKSWAGGQH